MKISREDLNKSTQYNFFTEEKGLFISKLELEENNNPKIFSESGRFSIREVINAAA